MLPADVNGIVEQRLVVGAHVQQDGQALFRGNAAERSVERHLADGNAHAARALVAEAEDAFAVADDDAAHLVVARVREDLFDAVLVGIAEEEAARLAPDLGEALAAFANGGRVDDRQQLLDVMRNERIEERLIVVLQVAHIGVFAEGRGAAVENALAALALVLQGSDMRGKQAVKGESVALASVNAVPLLRRGFMRRSRPERLVRTTRAGGAGAESAEFTGSPP